MTNELDDIDLQVLLLQADPLDVTVLRDIADGEAALALRDAITGATVRVHPRRRRLAVLAAVAVAAVVAALAFVGFAPTPSSAPHASLAAQVVQFARQSPKLLIGTPGWHVTDLNQDYDDTGNMAFGSGSQSIDMDWDTPASTFGPFRTQVADGVPATIDGQQALVGPVDGRGGSGPMYYVAIWSVGDQGIRVRGRFDDQADFLAVAQTLHEVDVQTFVDALPASVVTPDGRAAAVQSMLADIPQPAGFDPSTLSASPLLLDRYQLGAHVTSAVGCAWLDQWLHGSAAARVEASQAMQTSHHWAILLEMGAEGGWSQGFWQIADVMNGAPLFRLSPGETEAGILENNLGC